MTPSRLLLFLSMATLLVAVTFRLPAAQNSASWNLPAFANSNLVIVCTNGSEWSSGGGAVQFHGEVRVLESRMYMECELLTIYSDTNAPVSGDSLTNANFRLSTIVAETNLLIMTRDTTIIGERGVYTASNEVVSVTGSLVIIETDRGYTYCTNVVVNRNSGQGYVVGWNVVEVRMTPGIGGTNASLPNLGPPHKPKPSTSK